MNIYIVCVLIIALGVIVTIAIISIISKKINLTRERRQKQKNELLKHASEYQNRDLFFDMQSHALLDENLKPILDEKLDIWFSVMRESITASIVPVTIEDVSVELYERKVTFFLDVRSTPYEFEIKYCSDFNIIALSPILGDVYLPKQKFHQYQVGKTIWISFLQDKRTRLDRTVRPVLVENHQIK